MSLGCPNCDRYLTGRIPEKYTEYTCRCGFQFYIGPGTIPDAVEVGQEGSFGDFHKRLMERIAEQHRRIDELNEKAKAVNQKTDALLEQARERSAGAARIGSCFDPISSQIVKDRDSYAEQVKIAEEHRRRDEAIRGIGAAVPPWSQEAAKPPMTREDATALAARRLVGTIPGNSITRLWFFQVNDELREAVVEQIVRGQTVGQVVPKSGGYVFNWHLGDG